MGKFIKLTKLFVFIAVFSSSVQAGYYRCLSEYTKKDVKESPNALIEAHKYKKAIARSFEEINELIEDLKPVNPELSLKVERFFTDVKDQRVVDGGAGLSIYGVELALKGAKVKAFSGQDFLSFLSYFENPEFMKKFIPAEFLTEDRVFFSVKNLNRMDMTDGFPALEFPIKGEVLHKIAQLTNNQKKLSSYAYKVGVASLAEIQEMRDFVSTMVRQYSQMIKQLESKNQFNYYHLLDRDFYATQASEASSIDRYIDFNGAYYYKRDKVSYLEQLLEKLSPGGKAILISDGGSSRFTVGNISLADYLVSKWPHIFSQGKIRQQGIFGEGMTQQVLFIEKPVGQIQFHLSDYLEIETNAFSEDAYIPKTNFKEKSK